MPHHTIAGDFPDDPERALAWALRMERIVTYRSQGLGATKIVEKLRADTGEIVSVDFVNQLLREYADHVKDRTVELGEQRFAEHDARCEYMYAQIQERLLDPTIDDKVFSALVCAAIRVIERQAKLFGLDRQKTGPGGVGNNWMEHATPTELASIATRLGIKVPDRFDIKVNN